MKVNIGHENQNHKTKQHMHHQLILSSRDTLMSSDFTLY